MAHPKKSNELIGKTFGLLAVMEKLPKNPRPYDTSAWYRCACKCGAAVFRSARELRRSQRLGTKSVCGGKCPFFKEFMAEVNAKNGNAHRKYPIEHSKVYSNYKNRSKEFGREFKLEPEEFQAIVHSACFYCGVLPKVGDRHTVDRVDTRKGYIPSNVVPACKMCNTMKWNFSKTAFIEKCEAIADRHGKAK